MNNSGHRREKFIAYLSQKNDYLFFVGIQVDNVLRWEQVYQIDGDELIG